MPPNLQSYALAGRFGRVDAVLAQDLLHAANGVAFVLQEVVQAPQQLDVARTIQPAPAAALHGFELRELGFPEAQHVLLDAQLQRHLTDIAKRLHRLRQGQPPLKGASVPIRLFCRSAPDQTRVDAILHDVARPEYEHATRRDRNFLTRLRIASDALALLADAERAERRQLDRMSSGQAGRNLAKYQFHQLLRLVTG